jgi:RNA polymerase sigma-70 factor (ECF subfamily)
MQTTIAPRFNHLIEQHYQPLFRFAAALCGRPETALELTQRTFHRALERGVAPPTQPNVKRWLFTILFLEFLEDRPRSGCSAKKTTFS